MSSANNKRLRKLSRRHAYARQRLYDRVQGLVRHGRSIGAITPRRELDALIVKHAAARPRRKKGLAT